MKSYVIWNNVGVSSKTSPTYTLAKDYANKNPNKRVIILDLNTQATLTKELLKGNEIINTVDYKTISYTIADYIKLRLSNPDHRIQSNMNLYKSDSHQNLFLIFGDPNLSLLLCSVYQTSMVSLPKDRYVNVYNWLYDLMKAISYEFNNQLTFFIDCEPTLHAFTIMSLNVTSCILVPYNKKIDDKVDITKLPVEYETKEYYKARGIDLNKDCLWVDMNNFDSNSFVYP